MWLNIKHRENFWEISKEALLWMNPVLKNRTNNFFSFLLLAVQERTFPSGNNLDPMLTRG